MNDRTEHERGLVILMNHVHRGYRRAMNRILGMRGISESQALPVRLIAALGEGIRQGVLAEHIGVEGPSLGRQIDHLCAAGLVDRRMDPTDARGRTLHLTAAGRDLANELDVILSEQRQDLFADITDEELSTTMRALKKIDQAIECIEKKGRR